MTTTVLTAEALSTTQDIQRLFHDLRKRSVPGTRVIVNIYNHVWKPVLGKRAGNWLTPGDVTNLLELEGFQVIRTGSKGWVPLFPQERYIVARPAPVGRKEASVSIVIPVRNESGNLETLIQKLPKFGTHQELLFVEGHSRDDSWQELFRLKRSYRDRDIHILKQQGVGKADAIRLGFARAKGEVLIILDADLSVDPQDLTKFYEALVSGKGEFINGSRLVYPVEKEAMRFLNILGNQFFSMTLSWIINQHIKDTLCGTKAISRTDYERIKAGRKYFGDFDPFGDFDLIFGAARLNLKFIEIPVRYHARTYGTTNISRFRHGLLLLQMTLFALGKFKFA